MRTRLDLQPMLGPSLLEMPHDPLFMKMPKLGSFSAVGFSTVNEMAVLNVPNETIEWIGCSRGSAF